MPSLLPCDIAACRLCRHDEPGPRLLAPSDIEAEANSGERSGVGAGPPRITASEMTERGPIRSPTPTTDLGPVLFPTSYVRSCLCRRSMQPLRWLVSERY